MKLQLLVLLSFLVSMTLCGCKKGDGAFDLSSLFGTGISAGTTGTGSSGSGEEGSGSGGVDSNGDPVGFVHHPEPATLGLLSFGLFAYALLKKRRKNSP
ncbi:MAG: PEP-CTERM sorting domain-containing protein [Candidatus Omnitrophota bacterium]